ncbi:MAG: hypothetical protein GY772_18050, partial [bacterium]|nr:hypothetical protein [bacterium]
MPLRHDHAALAEDPRQEEDDPHGAVAAAHAEDAKAARPAAAVGHLVLDHAHHLPADHRPETAEAITPDDGQLDCAVVPRAPAGGRMAVPARQGRGDVESGKKILRIDHRLPRVRALPERVQLDLRRHDPLRMLQFRRPEPQEVVVDRVLER